MEINIKIRRIATRLNELFEKLVDVSDSRNDNEKADFFYTRALAATAIMIKCENDIEPKILSHSITDGFNDMGIDAIFLDNGQKKLFLVQSKWRKNARGSISQAEMLNFAEGIRRVINLDFKGANKKIEQKEKDVEFATSTIGYQISTIFIHTGNQRISEYALCPMNVLLKSVNDDANTLLTFEELDYNAIYSFFASGQNSQNIDIDDVVLYNWGKGESPFPIYYGMASAAMVGAWVNKYDNAIFAKNIRYYKGDTDVNTGIKKVLTEEPENFLYYNNGIKILCGQVAKKPVYSTTNDIGIFALSGVSIVNGAQTAGSIAKAYQSNSKQVEKAKVFLQIIDLSSAPNETSLTITRLSNTQNKIDGKDFISQDPNQERIRQELLFYHIEYLYKSGDGIREPSKQICFDEAIVALACASEEISLAVLAKSNVGALYDSIVKPPYKTLFNSDTNSFFVYNATIINRIIEENLQNAKKTKEGREKLTVIHSNRFVAFCVFHQIKKSIVLYQSCLLPNSIVKKITPAVEEILQNIIKIVKNDYEDSYPAYIFKNVSKCKVIYEKIFGSGNHKTETYTPKISDAGTLPQN